MNPLPLPATEKTALRVTYAYIEAFIRRHNLPPSIFQIARGRRLSYDAARGQVELMQWQGWIERDTSKGTMEMRGAG
jgi:hypothetical protein